MNRKFKRREFIEFYFFCNIINVFTVSFDPFHFPLCWIKKILLSSNFWKEQNGYCNELIGQKIIKKDRNIASKQYVKNLLFSCLLQRGFSSHTVMEAQEISYSYLPGENYWHA